MVQGLAEARKVLGAVTGARKLLPKVLLKLACESLRRWEEGRSIRLGDSLRISSLAYNASSVTR